MVFGHIYKSVLRNSIKSRYSVSYKLISAHYWKRNSEGNTLNNTKDINKFCESNTKTTACELVLKHFLESIYRFIYKYKYYYNYDTHSD